MASEHAAAAGEARVFKESGDLAHYVAECARDGRRLRIIGSGSKDFYGNSVEGQPVSLAGLRGVRDYVASELYITAAAATPLSEIDSVLQGQVLPFDPPRFEGGGTFGGAIAAGLSGPGKPRYGGVRDAVLGVRLINGSGEQLNFGGRVMKNVAGYDVSRLMAGALGTLGIICEATVKVIPAPGEHCTLQQAHSPQRALQVVGQLIQDNMPLSASFYQDGQLYLRLAGTRVDWAAQRIGGARADEDTLWRQLRDQTLPFFQRRPLWRISVPPTEQAVAAYSEGLAGGDIVAEWNGALYWQAGGDAEAVRQQARQLGGYACLFRRAAGDESIPYLPPLPDALLHLHRQLKQAFDPAAILNVGRMY